MHLHRQALRPRLCLLRSNGWFPTKPGWYKLVDPETASRKHMRGIVPMASEAAVVDCLGAPSQLGRAAMRMRSRVGSEQLVGNRLVLTGAVLYLLEWVAIIGGGIAVPLGPGTAQREVVDAYSGHANSIGWASGWFSVVLIGRIIFVVGLRAGLVASGRPQPLLDVAVAAMTAGVVLEVVTYAMTTAAAGPTRAISGPGTAPPWATSKATAAAVT